MQLKDARAGFRTQSATAQIDASQSFAKVNYITYTELLQHPNNLENTPTQLSNH